MTTMIIDRKKHKVYSDSRGTITSESTSVSLLPFPKLIKIKKHKFFDDIVKIFKIGRTVVSGSGSLEVIASMTRRIQNGKFFTPTHFIMKLHHNPSETDVFCSKFCNSETRVIRYYIAGFNILGKYYFMKVKKTKYNNSDYVISGSGCEYAQGCLFGKDDPILALSAAKAGDAYTGGETVTVELK